jgi:hypothetical protein
MSVPRSTANSSVTVCSYRSVKGSSSSLCNILRLPFHLGKNRRCCQQFQTIFNMRLTSHGSTLYVYRSAKSDDAPARGDGPIRTAGYNGAWGGGGGATRTLLPKTDEKVVEWKDAWGSQNRADSNMYRCEPRTTPRACLQRRAD